MIQRAYRRRMGIGLVGVLVILVGLAAWSLETEYGGNSVGGSETAGDVTRVFDIDEGSLDSEGHPVTTIVFEGTEAEAESFMKARWGEGRNYVYPAIVIGAGVLLLAGAFVPVRRSV